MHFGLFCLNTQRNPAKSPGEIYRETTEHVQAAERAGFEIAWFAEHHFSNYCLCPSPMTMLTYTAARTSTIRLGPAVIVAPLYDAIRLTEDIGVADQLSGGRLVLGFGTGYQQYEFHKFGRDLKEAPEDFLEVLDFMEAYLAGGAVSFEGRRIRMADTHFSVRPIQSRPDIYIAGMPTHLETQRRVAERGYIPFTTTGWSTADEVLKGKQKLAETYAAAGGDAARMPYAIQRYVCVAESREAALRAADGARYIRRIAMAMRGQYAELDGAYIKEAPAADEPSLEEIAKRMPIGDPATVAERIARDIEVLNPDHISCFMGIPGLRQAEVLASIERFGAEVIPLLEKRLGNLSLRGNGAAGRQPVARTGTQ